MSQLELVLLGSPQARIGESLIAVESRKALALLFYLAVTQEQHTRDRLATLFWSEQDQTRARTSLRQVLWLLRQAGLGEWLIVEQDALALQQGYWCDVHVFEAKLDGGALADALALYRDEFLAGFSLRDCPEFDQWQFLQAETLRRRLAGALETEVLRCVQQGEYDHGLDHARRWLALDPLHEPTHRHLMQLYALAGQHATALRQYEECVRLLGEELGVPPEETTTALYQAIKTRQITPPAGLAPHTHPAPSADGHPPHTVAADRSAPGAASAFANLPVQLTPFVGRETEVDDLEKLLADENVRLVSVVGPGGIGKTRLAVQAARRFAVDPADQPSTPRFVHGVLFVDLSSVDSMNGMVTAIAEAGGFTFYSNHAPRQQLLAYLRGKQMLLLLDSFEQLLPGTEFVTELLTQAPGITVLVTSREALNLQGEWQWVVSGLPVPEEDMGEEQLWQHAAVRLFVQNARRVQPDFALAAEAKSVARLCRLVEGMPLALELAAAWLRVVPCAQIAHEIERDLSFLTTRLRDVPDRHRSIQAVFEHSWRLLTPSEQRTFQQLSIFRGGFDRNAAEQVAGASWLDLATLVEKSLLSVSSNGRYHVHELLRQYGAGNLASDAVEAQATVERFCSYFADFLYEREARLTGPEQIQAAADIAVELDNIRAASQYAVQQRRLDLISRGVTAFYFFCQLQSRFLEGAQALEAAQTCLEALDPSPQRDLTLANIYTHQGWLYIRLGAFEKAAIILQQGRDLYTRLDVPPQRFIGGDPTTPLALVHHIQGDFRLAAALGREALRMAEAQGNPHDLAYTHYALAATNLALGAYEVACEHIKGAMAAAQATGNRWFLSYILNESGKVARAMGDDVEAKLRFAESYTIKQALNDPEGMAVALNHLGEIAFRQASYAEAERYYQESLALYRPINDRGGLATSWKGLGQLACVQGDFVAAKQHFALALTLAAEIRFWPLVCSILLEVSRLLMQLGAHALAVELLTAVQHQPASDRETQERAAQWLGRWREEMNIDHVEEAVRRGREATLQAVVPAILTELNTLTAESNNPIDLAAARKAQ